MSNLTFNFLVQKEITVTDMLMNAVALFFLIEIDNITANFYMNFVTSHPNGVELNTKISEYKTKFT